MQPIYRIYDTVENRHTYDDYLLISPEWDIHKYEYSPVSPALDNTDWRYIVERATGIKDYNGLEIFENDIVSDGGDYSGKIEYEKNNCCFNIASMHMDLYNFRAYEVIWHSIKDKHLLSKE